MFYNHCVAVNNPILTDSIVQWGRMNSRRRFTYYQFRLKLSCALGVASSQRWYKYVEIVVALIE